MHCHSPKGPSTYTNMIKHSHCIGAYHHTPCSSTHATKLYPQSSLSVCVYVYALVVLEKFHYVAYWRKDTLYLIRKYWGFLLRSICLIRTVQPKHSIALAGTHANIRGGETGCGTHFNRKSSHRQLGDEESWLKLMPHPLFSKFLLLQLLCEWVWHCTWVVS